MKPEVPIRQETILKGLPAARGCAAGPVFLCRREGSISVVEYTVEPGAEKAELARYRAAYASVVRDLESLAAALGDRAVGEDGNIFECHLMMVQDQTVVESVERLIVDDRCNAEGAVRTSMRRMRAKFERMNDPYFRERVRDLDDIERRFLERLTGRSENRLAGLKRPSIIIADNLSPSETAQLPAGLVLGFATDQGSETSHVSMLARMLGIPSVAGLGDLSRRVRAGERIVIDGGTGEVILSPAPDTAARYDAVIARQRRLVEELAGAGSVAGRLKDGGEVLLYCNIHPGAPLEGVKELGARGIGLYRSEYLWLSREAEPSEEEQYRCYREAVEFSKTLSDKSSIALRVLDIGADKAVKGITAKEENPDLGNRSIRYLLSNPGVFRRQLRAMIRAASDGYVGIMYPMVSCIEEVEAANAMVESVKAELRAEGVEPSEHLITGCMIECPAAALIADALAEKVGFFSIGTNDLVQYAMASDRTNELVAHLYQPTHPAVLRLMRMTIDAANRHDIWVSVCGESAANPVIGVLWAAFGADALSMSATYIPVLSKIFSRLSRRDLDEYARYAAAIPANCTAKQVFDKCHEFLRAKIPDFDELAI